jgi:DNA ligase (NAD+)
MQGADAVAQQILTKASGSTFETRAGGADCDAIVEWFENEKNQQLIERLKQHGIDPKEEERGDRLEGTKLVITGGLDSMTRDEAKEAVRRLGGRVTGSVSGETDYLVVGESPGSSKLRDAEENDTPTIDEEEFLELIGEG